MNDYGGLGILLEEKEPPPVAGADHEVPLENVAPANSLISDPPPPKNEDLLPPLPNLDSVHPTEDLLPPLPHPSEDFLPPLPEIPLPDRLSPLPEDSHLRDSIIDSIVSTNCNSPNLVRNNSDDDLQDEVQPQTQDLSEIFLQNPSFFDYEINSQNLNLNSDFHLFPSVSSTTTASHQSPNVTDISLPTQSTAVPPPTNTSPLRRLKSLKNGIRKLSFSTSNSSSNVASPSTSSSTSLNKVRPTLNPIQTYSKFQDPATATINHHRHTSSRSSTTSTSSASSGTSSFVTNTGSTSIFINQIPSIVPSKTRKSRAISNGAAMLTPLTPPLSSPIITLSENLSKKTISSIEQNYFDTLNSKFSRAMVLDDSLDLANPFAASISGESSSSASSPIPMPTPRTRVSSISELNNANELLNYSAFLKQQKKSFVDAFELTRQHLIESGWCSDHDLNNLQLQQDSQSSQIDTKFLQIEEKLNKDYKMSLFNPIPIKKNRDVGRTLSMDFHDSPISPSLKVLESRCFSFADV